MEFGFLSAILPEYTFEEVIDFAAEHGFQCVELACWPAGKAARRYAGVTHINMETLTEEKAEYIKGYSDKKQVRISGIGYYPNPLSEDTEQARTAVQHIKACIAGAKLLEIDTVNTFIGRNRSKNQEENIRLFQETWPEIIAFAEECGVRVAIENCPMYFKDEWPCGDNLACSPAFWDTMFETIPSLYFGLNYDPSHLVWQRMDYTKPIYQYADKLFHFHVKDAKFYQDRFDMAGIFAAPSTYQSPKLPGQGDIDWGRVISALNDVKYQGAVVLEIEDRAYEDSLEQRQKAILLARDFMKQYIA